MARTYYEHEGYKIYEIAYPVGDAAAYYCLISGDRHYFRSLFQAQSYITRLKNP